MPPLPADSLPSAVLVWDGGQIPSCDRSAQLLSNVSVYLGRNAFEPDAPLTIRVGLRRSTDPQAVIADVSELDEGGTVLGVRTVAGGSCEALDEPLTLVVALMLDAPPAPAAPAPVATPAAQPDAPQENAPDREPPEAQETEASAVDHEKPEPPESHAFVSAGLATSFGKLPFFDFGPELRLAYKPLRFWGLEVSGRLLFGSRQELPGTGAIDFGLAEVGAALCPLESFRNGLLLRGCGGIELGWLRAKSVDLEGGHQRTEVVYSPELHLQIAETIGEKFLFGGGVELAFPIRPNQYVYRDPEGVRQLAFQMSVPSLGLSLFLTRLLP